MTATNDPTNKVGGEDRDASVGLVTVAVAGGNGPTSCKYCGETEGHHTGQCPVVSHHGGDS